MKHRGASKEILKEFRFVPWIVLFAGLLITWQTWRLAKVDAESDLQNYFNFRVREVVDWTQERMRAHAQVLRGVKGLFIASERVDRDEFQSYVSTLNLEHNYPGILGVGYAIVVRPAQLHKQVAELRREAALKGLPEYKLWPDGARELYTSIIYLEPFKGRNLSAFGYDMYSEPVRRAAMEQACDTGEASLSGKVLLVQETDEDVQAGFLLYVPLYRNGMPHGTVAQRRANIIGWVYSPLRMKDLSQGIYGERADDLDIHVYDGDQMTEQTLMYDSGEVNHIHIRTIAGLSAIRHLSLYGHCVCWLNRPPIMVANKPPFME